MENEHSTAAKVYYAVAIFLGTIMYVFMIKLLLIPSLPVEWLLDDCRPVPSRPIPPSPFECAWWNTIIYASFSLLVIILIIFVETSIYFCVKWYIIDIRRRGESSNVSNE